MGFFVVAVAVAVAIVVVVFVFSKTHDELVGIPTGNTGNTGKWPLYFLFYSESVTTTQCLSL
jgi:hypothetical protein